MRYLPIEQIERSPHWPVKHRPRPTSAEVAQARETGVVGAVTVRRKRAGLQAHPTYELLDGEREWAIAQRAQIYQVPAIIQEMSDEEARAFVRLRYRRTLPETPIERALRYRAAFKAQGGAGERGALSRAARALGMSRGQLKEWLALLELERDVQQLVHAGKLAHTKARRLAGLPADEQVRLAKQIVSQGWSARKLERHLRAPAEQGRAARDANLAHLARVIGERVGANVAIDMEAPGRGEIRLDFHSLEELAGILERPLLDRATREAELE